jgi:predicted  nucleic acid-binding Zn-ribbon protein
MNEHQQESPMEATEEKAVRIAKTLRRMAAGTLTGEPAQSAAADAASLVDALRASSVGAIARARSAASELEASRKDRQALLDKVNRLEATLRSQGRTMEALRTEHADEIQRLKADHEANMDNLRSAHMEETQS